MERREEERRKEERRKEEEEKGSKLSLPRARAPRRHARRAALSAARAQNCARGSTRAELRPPALKPAIRNRWILLNSHPCTSI